MKNMNMIFYQEMRGLKRLAPTLEKVRVESQSVVEAVGGGEDIDKLSCCMGCMIHVCCAWIFRNHVQLFLVQSGIHKIV